MMQKVYLQLILLILPFANGIVGGHTASPRQFPYMVSIRNKYDDHLCGGTIIHTKFVLTAGHCIRTRRPEDIRVVAGTNKLSVSSKSYKVHKVAVRGHWRKIRFSYDISILKLYEDIIFTKFIQPLPLYTSEPPVNVSMAVVGWGLKYFGAFEFPDKLHFKRVKTLSLSQCLQKFKNVTIGETINERNICTFTKNGEGVCSGDSGGPLVYKKQLVGIVSHGIPCAVGYPDIFIKVSAFHDWIKQTIRIL